MTYKDRDQDKGIFRERNGTKRDKYRNGNRFSKKREVEGSIVIRMEQSYAGQRSGGQGLIGQDVEGVFPTSVYLLGEQIELVQWKSGPLCTLALGANLPPPLAPQ